MTDASWKRDARARAVSPAEGARPSSSNAIEAAALTVDSSSGTDTSMRQLVSVIEGEVIPRLLLAVQSPPRQRAAEGADSEEVMEFARLVVSHDVNVAAAFVGELLARGVALEKIYLELLAPAARLLGEWWKQDLRNFTEVTSGLCRMRQLLRGFSPAFQVDAEPVRPERRLLLLPLPGEQHTFGLIMVAEFFRRGGWDVVEHPSASRDELLELTQREWFTVIGISLSRETLLGELVPLITDLRLASRNPGVGLMVGGSPFTSHPERAAEVGADATAADGRGATIEAAKLVKMLTQRT